MFGWVRGVQGVYQPSSKWTHAMISLPLHKFNESLLHTKVPVKHAAVFWCTNVYHYSIRYLPAASPKIPKGQRLSYNPQNSPIHPYKLGVTWLFPGYAKICNITYITLCCTAKLCIMLYVICILRTVNYYYIYIDI